MTFWQDLDNKQLQTTITRVSDALRDTKMAMRRFAPLGQLSHKLSAQYPDLRKLRVVISAFEKAAREGRNELLARRREVAGVARRHRKSREAVDTSNQEAAQELDTARRHVLMAVDALKSTGESRGDLCLQLAETAGFLELARSAIRRE